jgi:ribosomal protein S8
MPPRFKNIISYVNQQVQLQKFIIAVPINKVYLRFICFLYKENYLELFYLQNNFIFFKVRCFAGRSSLRQLVTAQKKSQKKYSRLPVLHKSGTKNLGSMVFSTSIGTLTQKQAAKIKTGGLLSCFLF